MAVTKIDIGEFIRQSQNNLVIDVRSPSEFTHAHFPSAVSLPIFEDEERKIIGTTYKQKSREKAVKIGLDLFGLKMSKFVRFVEHELSIKNSTKVFVYCWRGGMRSGAMSWLLDFYGLKVIQLDGGYKSFRNWVLEQLKKEYSLQVLSGFTGSGKTEILHELAKSNQPVIDLEGLAGHKGSAFGALGLPPQHGNEAFENLLAMELFQLSLRYKNQPIWIESESNRIGNDVINIHFFESMKRARHLHLEIPFRERLKKIVADYGRFEVSLLKGAVKRIEKRLGGIQTKQTLEFLENNEIENAFKILLKYYDKTYRSGKQFRPPFLEIELPTTDARQNTRIILDKIKENGSNN